MSPNASVVNAMTVAPSQQVMLKVRFLEATRQAERDLGVNWFVGGGNLSGAATGLGIVASGAANGLPLSQDRGNDTRKRRGPVWRGPGQSRQQRHQKSMFW